MSLVKQDSTEANYFGLPMPGDWKVYDSNEKFLNRTTLKPECVVSENFEDLLGNPHILRP